MGLCKCPKRQVTTQFCFEHRVNVCENCMIVNHTKCTVQSYIQWLKDSDYDSKCILCGCLRNTDECVRLICYHVFHWKCLNARQQVLSPNTAPGGHTCPVCRKPMIPPSNLVSPIADVLRIRFGQANWARNELGLSSLENLRGGNFQESKCYQTSESMVITNDAVHEVSSKNQLDRLLVNSMNQTNRKERHGILHSVLVLDSCVNIANSTRTTLSARDPLVGVADCDDNKYKRRIPKEIFSRWCRRLYAPSVRPVWQRTWFLIFTGLIGFLCIGYVMTMFNQDSPRILESGFKANRNLPHAEE